MTTFPAWNSSWYHVHRALSKHPPSLWTNKHTPTKGSSFICSQQSIFPTLKATGILSAPLIARAILRYPTPLPWAPLCATEFGKGQGIRTDSPPVNQKYFKIALGLLTACGIREMIYKQVPLDSDFVITISGTREIPARVRSNFISQIPWRDARVIQGSSERGHRWACWQA